MANIPNPGNMTEYCFLVSQPCANLARSWCHTIPLILNVTSRTASFKHIQNKLQHYFISHYNFTLLESYEHCITFHEKKTTERFNLITVFTETINNSVRCDADFLQYTSYEFRTDFMVHFFQKRILPIFPEVGRTNIMPCHDNSLAESACFFEKKLLAQKYISSKPTG